MVVLFDGPVTTRKPHRCFGCDIDYPAGTRMRRHVVKDLDLCTFYYCPVCEEVTKDWDPGDWDTIWQGEIRSDNIEGWNRIYDKQAALKGEET